MSPHRSLVQRSGFTLIELLVVIAIIGVLVGLLLPAVQKVREAANRVRCQNNLKQLGLAVHLFHDGNQCLPTATGSSGSSSTWLVNVLPYVEQKAMAAKYQFSQPGYSQAGSGCTGNQLKIATCPSDMVALDGGKTLGGTAYHNYACNVGNTAVGTPYAATNVMRAETSYYGNTFAGAPFAFGTPQMLTQVTDGTSNTLMLAEVIQGQRQDLRGLIYWVSAAGFVTSLRPNDTNPDLVTHGICDPNPPNPPANCTGANSAGNTHAIRAFATRSRHAGGVNVAFCDGSVRFIANTIDALSWQQLGTSQGGEVIQGDY